MCIHFNLILILIKIIRGFIMLVPAQITTFYIELFETKMGTHDIGY